MGTHLGKRGRKRGRQYKTLDEVDDDDDVEEVVVVVLVLVISLYEDGLYSGAGSCTCQT